MEKNNENTWNESWGERFKQLQSQNKQKNNRLKRFSETVLHVNERARASTKSPKCRARTSVKNPPTEQAKSNHQVMMKNLLPQGLLA